MKIRKLSLLLSVALACLLISVNGVHAQETDTAEANKALIWRFYEEFYVEKNKDDVEKYFNETFVEWGPGGVLTFTDYDSLHEYLNSNWPDLQVDMQTVFAEGDYVAARSVIWAPETGLDKSMAIQIFRAGKRAHFRAMGGLRSTANLCAVWHGGICRRGEWRMLNPQPNKSVPLRRTRRSSRITIKSNTWRRTRRTEKFFTEDFAEINPLKVDSPSPLTTIFVNT
ncbi:MAG: nuclear transport factor 2 family protein [Caldilineaceae bacterium]